MSVKMLYKFTSKSGITIKTALSDGFTVFEKTQWSDREPKSVSRLLLYPFILQRRIQSIHPSAGNRFFQKPLLNCSPPLPAETISAGTISFSGDPVQVCWFSVPWMHSDGIWAAFPVIYTLFAFKADENIHFGTPLFVLQLLLICN